MTVVPRSVLDWLLEPSDPGVRSFTLRDLLGAPADDPEVRAARRATVRLPPVRPILEAMKDEGCWVKSVRWLHPEVHRYGVAGHLPRPVRRRRRGSTCPSGGRLRARPQPHAPRRLFGNSTARRATPAGMIHCLEGNLGASLLELGFGDDPRLKEALDWLARSITGEGIAPASSKDPVRYYRSGNSAPGFHCAANNHKPCAWGAIPAWMRSSRVPAALAGRGAMRRAITDGSRVPSPLQPGTGELPDGLRDEAQRKLVQVRLPHGLRHRRASQCRSAGRAGQGPRPLGCARWPTSSCRKRDPDGRWRLEYSYDGKTWFDLGAKRAPNKWVTLRSLRALRGMGVNA